MLSLKRVTEFKTLKEIPYLIINHSIDFLKSDVFTGESYLDTRTSAVQELRRISRDEYNYSQDIYTYLIELVGKGYQTINGCPLSAKNPFLNELVDKELIHFDYRNSYLITLNGDYSFDIVDREMLNELAFRLADLKYTFNIPTTRILFLDDIINKDKNKKLSVPYNIKSMSKIDKSDVLLYLSKFAK